MWQPERTIFCLSNIFTAHICTHIRTHTHTYAHIRTREKKSFFFKATKKNANLYVGCSYRCHFGTRNDATSTT